MTRSNTFETGLSNGTAVSVANSDDGTAGNPWDEFADSGGALTYATAAAKNGSLGLQIASGTGAYAYVGWNGENNIALACEFWVKIPNVATSQRLITFRDASSTCGGLIIDPSSGPTIGVMATTTFVSASKSGALTVGSWYKVSIAFKNGTSSSGYAYLAIYNSSNTLVHSWDGAVSGASNNNLTTFRIGRTLTATDFNGALLLDDIRLNAQDTLPISAATDHSVTFTDTAGMTDWGDARDIEETLADDSAGLDDDLPAGTTDGPPDPGTPVTTPTAKIEIEFVDSTWTDVTAYWDAKRAITMSSGRSDTDERIQPGRLSGLMLVNDGRFTVGNTASPHYPNVASGRRVRVSLADPVTGFFYDRWTGYIDGWPLSWSDNGNTCWVTLSATDALLPLTEPLDGWLTLCHQRSGYTAYWPMTDNDETKQHAEVLAGWASLGAVLDATTCTEAGPAGDPKPLPNGGSYVGWWSGVLPATDFAWYASCLFKSTSKGTAFVPLRATSGGLAPMGSGGYEVGAYVSAEGFLCAARHNPGDDWTTSTTINEIDICDGSWWRLLISGTSEDDEDRGFYAGAYRVDDPNINTGSYLEAITAGQALLGTSIILGLGQRATVGHLGWATGENAPAFNATWFNAMAGGTLWSAAADYAGMSPYPVTLDAPGDRWASMFSRPVPATWSDWWAQVEAVDGGVTVAERDGTRTYLGGAYRARPKGGASAVIALTVTAEDIGEDLTVAVDRLKLTNEVTVSAVDATGTQKASARLVDAASIARSGRHAVSVEVYGQREPEGGVANVAADLFAPTEAARIPTITVDALTGGAALQQDLLFGEFDARAVGVWSLIGVTGLPTAGGFQTNWLGRVEGWTETLGIDTWTVTFNTSYVGSRVGDATYALVGSARVG